MDRESHAFHWGCDCTPQVALVAAQAVMPHEVLI
jgi:hypothetical protein